MNAGRANRTWLWIILALALLMRIVHLLDVRAHSVYWDSMLLDAQVYDEWARAIAGGDWVGGPDVFPQAPLYPYFLALVYGVAGAHYLPVYLLQAMMGLVSLGLIHAIGLRAFGPRVALLGTVLSALYAPFLFLESKLMGSTLAVLLGLGTLWLLLQASARGRWHLWCAAGLCLAAAALVRPEILLFAPCAAWWAARVVPSRQGGRKRRPVTTDWRAAVLLVSGLAVGLAPVALRNARVSGQWSFSNLISSQSGVTFYQSNNPRANGLYVFLSREGFSGHPLKQAEEAREIAEKRTGRSLTRAQVTRYWAGEGLRWIAGNPGRFVLVELQKLWRLLGSYEYSTEYVLGAEREWVLSLWIPFLPFAVLSGLAVAGLLRLRREGAGAPAVLLVLFLAASVAAQLMFYMSSRYRLPAAPAVILLGALGAERLWTLLRSGVPSSRVEGRVMALLLAAWVILLHPPFDSSSRIQESYAHSNAGNHHFRRQEYDDALWQYRRAAEKHDGNWRAHLGMGDSLALLGRNEEAMEAYRVVLQHNPSQADARRNLRALGGEPPRP